MSTSSFQRLSFDEIQDLHREMSDFVASYIAHTDNNRSAKLAAYGECNTRGMCICAPIYGCSKVSSALQNQVTKQFGSGAEISTEIDPDGGGIHASFNVPIMVAKSAAAPRKGARSPSFQTPLLLFLVDAALAGALYYKLFLVQ